MEITNNMITSDSSVLKEKYAFYIQDSKTHKILGRLLDGKGEEDIEFYNPNSKTFIIRKKFSSIKKIYDFLIEKGFENIVIKYEKTKEDIIDKLKFEFCDRAGFEVRYKSKQKSWTEEQKKAHQEELEQRGKGPVDGDERILVDDYFHQPEYDASLDIPVYTDEFKKYLKYMNKKRNDLNMNNKNYYDFIMNNQCDFCSRRCKMCHAYTLTTFYECNNFSFNSIEIDEIEEENKSIWDFLATL